MWSRMSSVIPKPSDRQNMPYYYLGNIRFNICILEKDCHSCWQQNIFLSNISVKFVNFFLISITVQIYVVHIPNIVTTAHAKWCIPDSQSMKVRLCRSMTATETKYQCGQIFKIMVVCEPWGMGDYRHDFKEMTSFGLTALCNNID